MVKNSERFEELEDRIEELDEEMTRLQLRLALFEARLIETEHQITLRVPFNPVAGPTR